MGDIFADDEQPTPVDTAAQQEIEMNKQQLEAKRKSLYAQRLDIIKSQGGENWSPATAQSLAPVKSEPKPAGGASALAGRGQSETDLLSAAIGQARGGGVGRQSTAS